MKYTFRVIDTTSHRVADYEIHASSDVEAWRKALEYIAEDGWDEANIRRV